jgi:hypothetical protein
MLCGLRNDVIDLVRGNARQSAANKGRFGLRAKHSNDFRAIDPEERKDAAIGDRCVSEAYRRLGCEYGFIDRAGTRERRYGNKIEGLACLAVRHPFPQHLDTSGFEQTLQLCSHQRTRLHIEITRRFRVQGKRARLRLSAKRQK